MTFQGPPPTSWAHPAPPPSQIELVTVTVRMTPVGREHPQPPLSVERADDAVDGALRAERQSERAAVLDVKVDVASSSRLP